MQLLQNGKQQFIDQNGLPLANGTVGYYAPGTLNPQATYQDQAGTIQNTNPITLDSRGQAIIWGTGTYRQIVKDASGVTIWDQIVDAPAGGGALANTTGAGGAALIGFDGSPLSNFFLSKNNRVVDSIAGLRALVKTTYTRAFVTGYYAAGDGGGGAYWYDPTDTTSTDNGGTIIVASDGGRWKLQDTTRISAKQFGAKGDNATDDTSVIQAALNWLYAAGGGTLYFPAATYLVTSLALNFAASLTVNIQGAGKFATYFKKTGSSTTPVFNWSANTNVLENFSDFSDFSIIGNAQAHPGITVTQCASFTLKNVDIGHCSTGLNNVGSLIFTVRSCRIHDNVTGYACAKSSNNIYANLVGFYDTRIIANSTLGVDLNGANGVFFSGCDFESNGTSLNNATGAVKIEAGIAAEIGYSKVMFDKCWFEANLGTLIQNDSTGNPAFHLSIKDSNMLSSQNGNVMNITSTNAIVVLDNTIAPSSGDTVTLSVGRTDIRDGIIFTITDTSPVQHRRNVATESGTIPNVALTGSNGGYTQLVSGMNLFGPTAQISGLSATVQISQKGNTYSSIIQADGSGGTNVFFSTVNTGGVGSITTTSGATQYNTTSDYRLKQNVLPMIGAIDSLMALKPSTFEFKSFPGTRVQGFIAHEVQSVVPEAITGEKDAMRTQKILDENGNVICEETVPDYQHIDHSKLVPLLVGALQEAVQRIKVLESQAQANHS